MKLSIFLLFVTIFNVFGSKTYSQNARLNLDMKDVPIRTILNTIEGQSEFFFLYSSKMIDINQKVDINIADKKITEILDELLANTDIKYAVRDRQILLFNKEAEVALALQQKITTGRITDSNGNPLAGVNVVEKGTTNGVVADQDGKYSITVSTVNSVLSFSFIGYTTQDITVGSQNSINVSLVESAIGLDEIVVVGYGTQQKRTISGSITSVTEKSFNTGVTRTAVDLLQGKVAGLSITTSTGDVTSTQSMRLRGTSSLSGSSEPFVVVDGVPGMSLNSVAPQDIESISILKDASSAAIYGSRSASGVILITTKKGKANQSTVDYNGYIAIDNVTNKPDVLTAEEWRNYTTENGMNTTGMDLGANTDWFGEIMRQGVTQNHDLSFSGGAAKSSYRASVSYLDQQGVMIDNYQKKLNTRLAINQKALKDRLDISLIGSMDQRDYQPANTGNFVLAYNMIPVTPVYLADGTFYDKIEFDQGNPVRNITYNSNKYKVNNFYVNLKADLKILKNLTAGINVFKQRGTEDRSLYNNSQTEDGRDAGGFAQRQFRADEKKLLETTINYTGQTGKHNYSLLGGYSYEDNYMQSARAQNRIFVTDLFTYNNLSAGEKLMTGDVTSSADMSRLISFFGRLNYLFSERYILSATVRRDGSSKFGANNQWGTFPSVSAAWRLSDEPFMLRFSGVLDELKLRVGYGVSGNQDGIAPYKSLSLYGSSGTYWAGGSWRSAYRASQNPNADLRWEETAMFNVGADYSLFDGRINGAIEYYDKRTSNLLYTYQVPVPPYLYSSMIANVGTMKNTGIEFLINGDIIRKNDLRWNVSFNISHNENLITSLSNAEFATSLIKTGDAWVRGGSANTTHVIQEGYPVGTFYGWKCLGISETGMYLFDDMINGKAGLTDEDRTYIGDANPKFIYGINNSLTYKDFELSFFLRGVYGNDVLNFSRMSFATTQWLPGANVLYDAIVSGIKDTPKYSSFYIEDGSFLRMENMNLAYSIKPNVLGVNLVRFYVTAHNLFTVTKYHGVDPEVRMSGLDPGVEGREYYPKSRTFMFGVNVNF